MQTLNGAVTDVRKRLAELEQTDLGQATAWEDNAHELMHETLQQQLHELTQPPEQRYAPVVRKVLPPALADQVLHDKAWPALAGALAKAEQLGAQPADVLAAAAERELSSAKSVADVLAFRVAQHHVPAQPGPAQRPPRTWWPTATRHHWPLPAQTAAPDHHRTSPHSAPPSSSSARPTPSGGPPRQPPAPPTTSPPRTSTNTAKA